MRKGKIAAQAAHASMKVFFDRATIGANRMIIDINEDMSLWAQDGFKKVVLSVEDKKQCSVHMLMLRQQIYPARSSPTEDTLNFTSSLLTPA